MEPKQHQPCNCRHEGWPRAVSNIAIATMFGTLFVAMAWIINTAVSK